MAAKKTTAKKTTTKKTTARKPVTAKKTAGKRSAAKNPTTKKGATKSGDKKMSALDAAAKVLSGAKEPLNSKQMIERMEANGYWISPGGQTPASTLYAAIIREIQKKGKEARFTKADRGLFAANK